MRNYYYYDYWYKGSNSWPRACQAEELNLQPWKSYFFSSDYKATYLCTEKFRNNFRYGFFIEYNDKINHNLIFIKNFFVGLLTPWNVVISNPHRSFWERYQPISDKLCSRSGIEAKCKNMLSRCNDIGVKIIQISFKYSI